MANFAFVIEQKIEGVYDLLPQNWKNISNFCALDDWDYLNSLGWYKLEKITPEYSSMTQKLGKPIHYFENNIAYETYEVEEVPVIEPIVQVPSNDYSEFDSYTGMTWEKIREKRNQLMADFEWRYTRYHRNERLGLTQIDDLQKMDEYMKALADITLQTDPNNILWPNYTGE